MGGQTLGLPKNTNQIKVKGRTRGLYDLSLCRFDNSPLVVPHQINFPQIGRPTVRKVVLTRVLCERERERETRVCARSTGLASRDDVNYHTHLTTTTCLTQMDDCGLHILPKLVHSSIYVSCDGTLHYYYASSTSKTSAPILLAFTCLSENEK
jgi:hypothetical protein